MKKILGSVIIPVLCSLMVGCASTGTDGKTSGTVNVKEVAARTFGGANFKIHEVSYSSGIASAVMGSTSEEFALLREITPAQSAQVNLVLWGRSSALSAGVITRCFQHYVPLSVRNGNLSKLRLLYIGKAEDAQNIKPLVEASGATFLFHAAP
ncbi:MAG: hypothetical protein LBK71_03200 [Verrucomicrobiales bacterium]|jgi:hypothetical protein|nr:hypothetical protein [Verrucomicrobiales bacterium]